jgi:ATP-dependent Zn protease
METLHRLATALLEKEVLDTQQIDTIIKGEAVA